MCTASSSSASARIDAALTPPLHLSQEEQLAKLHADDANRGRMQMQLPPLNDKGDMAYSGWGDYFTMRQWGEAGNDLDDRLLLQSITGALSCVLTTHLACTRFDLDASEQLFDLRVDPRETRDLSNEPASASRLADSSRLYASGTPTGQSTSIAYATSWSPS